MEWALMVVAIVGITTWAKVHRAKHGIGRREWDREDFSRKDDAESIRLREEVRALKERIATLERITVDRENSLARQIDDLRDR